MLDATAGPEIRLSLVKHAIIPPEHSLEVLQVLFKEGENPTTFLPGSPQVLFKVGANPTAF